ncbi:hypothetical protein BDN70DRAFT_912530 [Pholiota conissans]|uniref:Uncharacterized protein n=1 Tax=Pholiota conissans TaxID=109636 RepID=A0A9P5Z4D0_9AGAR|nr:hypothetical protein BDN70DRAFT_912530 [Pholiota conissans]
MTESNGSDTNGFPRHARPRALTSRQERKLLDYLDENFLQLTRNFKKRSDESSTLRTLGAYLEESRRLLAFILQIPPIDPSTSLRISYMLRLTGEALTSIPGYRLGAALPSGRDGASTDSGGGMRAALQDLVDFLDDLDQAWLAVLKGQAWDPASSEGVDVAFPNDVAMDLTDDPPPATNGIAPKTAPTLKTSPPTQTDLTRLRSLLLAGESRLEEWLTNERNPVGDNENAADALVEVEDVSAMLDRMGLLEDFDSLFVRTLDYLGGFGSDIAQNVVHPEPEAEMIE